MDFPLHPIVEQMSLSEQQREAVNVCDSDAVVTAGAGSGKTRTLVARYLSLLPDVSLPVRSIVAATFTNRAAREMRNRVRREIGRYLSREDLKDDQRTLWENRYRDLDAARIGTIHSLCAEILRCHPAEARLDPNFEVLDESLAAALRESAVENWGAGGRAASDYDLGFDVNV